MAAQMLQSIESAFAADPAGPSTEQDLHSVLALLQQLKLNGLILELNEAAKICWLASREESWRAPLGQSGILSFFLDLLYEQMALLISVELVTTLLKIVGNTCADKDENRRRVVEHSHSLHPLVSAIQPGIPMEMVGLIVLLNVCKDYESAQLEAISCGALGPLFSGLSPRDEFLVQRLEILELLLDHSTAIDACPRDVYEVIIRVLKSDGVPFDEVITLLRILDKLFGSERFRHIAASTPAFEKLCGVLAESYYIDPESEPGQESKDASLLTYARSQIVSHLAEIAFIDDFLQSRTLDDIASTFNPWLDEQDPLKVDKPIAACLILGNIARSDEICTALANKHNLHEKLKSIVCSTLEHYRNFRARAEEAVALASGERNLADMVKVANGAMQVGILHAAVGTLRNLAIPKENKRLLGDAGLLGMIDAMLALEGMSLGQIYYSAVWLGRLLTVGTVENVERFLTTQEDGVTLLEREFGIYDKVEEEPTKNEVSRTVASVLRLAYTSDPPNQDLLDKLLAHGAKVARVLWDMVLQDKWAAVRGEGWFALALLSRQKAGANLVLTERGQKEEGKARKILFEEPEGGSPEEVERMRKVAEKERDNVTTFLAEVVKNADADGVKEVKELLEASVRYRAEGGGKRKEEAAGGFVEELDDEE